MSKLPEQLQELLDEHSQNWAYDEEVFSKRVSNAQAIYSKSFPNLGDKVSHAKVILSFESYYEALKCIQSREFDNYELDLYQSRLVNSTYRLSFIKPKSMQATDLKRIKKCIKEEYEAELYQTKLRYIEQLTSELEEQERNKAEYDIKAKQNKLKEALLDLI